MRRVFIRSGMVFIFSVFGKKVIALAGAILLFFVTALLIDFHLYASAGLAGVLSALALVLFVVQYFRQIKERRERERRRTEDTARRAAAADARGQKMDKAKSVVSDTVRGMTGSAADMAKTGFNGARDRVQGWRK
jgi:membrane protein implicated in regulation of membrane protease activity